jgi:hypothetical protein
MNTRDSNFDDEDDEKYLATKNNENEILRDLFWTLFSKLECVTQGHSTVLIAGQRLLRVRRTSCNFFSYLLFLYGGLERLCTHLTLIVFVFFFFPIVVE